MISASTQVFARRLLFQVLDPLVVFSVMLFAVHLRGHIAAPEYHWMLSIALLPGTVLAMHMSGAYEALGGYMLSRWCGRALAGLALMACAFLAAAYMMKISAFYSRGVVVGWFAGSTAALVLARIFAHRLIVVLHKRGVGRESVVLAGTAEHCEYFLRHLDAHPELGMTIAAVAVAEPSSSQSQKLAAIRETETQTRLTAAARSRLLAETEFASRSQLAREPFEQLPALVDRFDGARVILCCRLADRRLLMEAMNLLLTRPVTVQYALDYSNLPIFAFGISECAGHPLLDLSASPLPESSRLLKWIEDKVLAALIVVLTGPLMLLIATLVIATSPGPVFYVQERHGLNGRRFRVYKFRTMRSDLQPAVRPAVATAGGVRTGTTTQSGELAPHDFVPARQGDPRVTTLGRILRRTSLDELPQFFNVLRGDMSIVGPRPHAVRHNEQFMRSIGELMRRHYVKPGITGLAQISGARGEAPTIRRMRTRLRYDLEYIRNWSLFLDLKIIAVSAIKGFWNREP
jgi:putative colanic acid biosynthesis UDP-glucose lipid carrier transferase